MSRAPQSLVCAAAIALAELAAADQCAVLSRSQVGRAAEVVRPGDEILRLCEPCGETGPVALQVRQVEAGVWEPGASDDLWELQVNRIGIDAAYVFVAEGDRWRNLAAVIGCPAEGVSTEITWRPPAAGQEESLPAHLLVVNILHRAYDGSRFGRQWRTTQPTTLLVHPEATAPEVGQLAVGEAVTALELESHVTPVIVHVVHDRGRFRKSERFTLLDSLGEGFFRAWHHGELVTDELSGLDVFQPANPGQGCRQPSADCWGEAEAMPRERWWARVATADGREGWVEDPLASFGGVLLGH